MLRLLSISDLNFYYMRAVQPSQTEPVIVAQSSPDPSRSSNNRYQIKVLITRFVCYTKNTLDNRKILG